MPNLDNPTNSLNLLPENAYLHASSSQIVFRFMITRGKSIIVFTEAVVLLVFLSRFKLDRQVSDLQEALENKNAIVEASQSIETQYRSVQTRTVRAKEIVATQPVYTKQIELLDMLEQSGIGLESSLVKPGSLELSASTQSAVSFGTFIGQVVSQKDISGVILQSSSYNANTKVYTFKMMISFQKV